MSPRIRIPELNKISRQHPVSICNFDSLAVFGQCVYHSFRIRRSVLDLLIDFLQIRSWLINTDIHGICRCEFHEMPQHSDHKLGAYCTFITWGNEPSISNCRVQHLLIQPGKLSERIFLGSSQKVDCEEHKNKKAFHPAEFGLTRKISLIL
ncbi:hypothetical protein D3C86_1798260 [compost metagenome]